MKLRSLGLVLLLSGFAASAAAEELRTPIASKSTQSLSAPSQVSLDRVPLAFEVNRGQTDARARFLARARDMGVYLTETGARLSLVSASESAAPNALGLRLHFADARPHSRIEGEDPLPGRSHYLIGNDPRRWQTDVPQYRRVRYRDVYPGVDVVYFGREGKLEFDLEVAPGADLAAVRLRLDGVDKLSLDANGDLRLHTPLGDLIQHRPEVYQIVAGQRRPVRGDYVLRDMGGTPEIAFHIDDYDRRMALVIDPTLVAAFLAGGSGGDIGKGVAADAAGSWYFVGDTPLAATNFPTTVGAYQIVHAGSTDIFVRKLSSDASTVLYSTLIGGGSLDTVEGVGVDASGNAYIAGWSTSSNYPTTLGALQTAKPGGASDAEGVVTALNAAGSALIYSTYLGGSMPSFVGGFPTTRVRDIAVEADGTAYVTGETAAADLPTHAEAFQSTMIGPDNAFVFKFGPAGARVFGTYVGDIGDFAADRGRKIALDDEHNVYLVGRTHSTFSTDYNGVVPTRIGPGGSDDILLARLNHTGAWLDWVTQIGGSALDTGGALAVDQGHRITLAARSLSEDLPPNTIHSDNWSWLAQFDASGTQRLDSTWVGAAGANVFPNGLVWDADNMILIGDVQNISALAADDAIAGADCGASCGNASTFGGMIAEFADAPLTQQSMTRVVGGANTRFNDVAQTSDSATGRTAVTGNSDGTPAGTVRPPGDLSGNNSFGLVFDQGPLPVLPPEVTKHFEPPSVEPLHRAKLVFVIRNPNVAGNITGIDVLDLLPACLANAYVLESSLSDCPGLFGVGANAASIEITQSNAALLPGQVCTIEIGIKAGGTIGDCINTTAPIDSDQGQAQAATATLKIVSNSCNATTTGTCTSMNMDDDACWNGGADVGNTCDAEILPCAGGTCTINYDRPPNRKVGHITFDGNTTVTGTNPVLLGDGLTVAAGVATITVTPSVQTAATSLDVEVPTGAALNFVTTAILSDGSYLDISGDGTVEFAAGLDGGGSLIVESGTVTTSADTLIDGDIDVVGGTLIANDFVEPDVFVSGNGRLEGSGPFSAMKLTATGTFSSGETLDVTSMASFDVEDSATVEIDFGAGNATFGPIASTGPITLEENATLKLNLTTTAAPGTMFNDLITSPGGLITGCFAAGTTNQPQLGATVQCTATAVSATIVSTRIFYSGFEN